MSIGPFVRNRRHALKMTLRDLSATSSISFSFLARIERGQVANPRPATLERLADALAVSVGDLRSAHDLAHCDAGIGLSNAQSELLRQIGIALTRLVEYQGPQGAAAPLIAALNAFRD